MGAQRPPEWLMHGWGVLLLIGAVIGVILMLHSDRRRRKAWAGVARDLALTLSPGAIGSTWQLSGQLHGQLVRAFVISEGHRQHSRLRTVVVAQLAVPVDLHLSVRDHGSERGLAGRFSFGSGGRALPIGDPLFEGAFKVQGDESSRVAALLTPKLRKLLTSALRHGHHFEIDDRGMMMISDGASTSQQYLGWALDVCARTTSKIDRQRRNVPPATVLATHVQTWSSFAAAHGLTFEHTPLSMRGSLEGSHICAHAVRAPHDFRFELTNYFPRPLGIGLQVQPQGLLCETLQWLGALQDHVVGDPVFDDMFWVSATNPAACNYLLDADVRRRLVLVQSSIGPLSLDDRGITVRLQRLGHPEAVPTAVQEMAKVATLLRHKQLRSPQGAERAGVAT